MAAPSRQMVVSQMILQFIQLWVLAAEHVHWALEFVGHVEIVLFFDCVNITRPQLPPRNRWQLLHRPYHLDLWKVFDTSELIDVKK